MTSVATLPIMTEYCPGATLRILVAEDDADSADALVMLLRIYGHDVEVARSGTVALELAQSHSFDVILLDIGLPGMNGYEIAEELADHGGPRKPLLIAITGYGAHEDREQSRKSGIDLHMIKPVAPNLLEGVLGRFARLLYE